MQNIALVSPRGGLVAGRRSATLLVVDTINTSLPSHRASVLLLAAGLLALAACAATEHAAPPSSPECGQGAFVEADSSAFCIFRRDEPLVIEGGFECPERFAFRLEMGSSIACSNRAFRIESLPHAVCLRIGEDCQLAQLRAVAPSPRIGGAGECVTPCETAADCGHPAVDAGSFGQDNVACVDNACRRTGCNDDDECVTDYPDWPIVCRADFRDEVPYCRDGCEETADCLYGDRDAPELAQVECVEGACLYIGCTSDVQCPAPAECLAMRHGYRECAFRCASAEDCAAAAREGLGIDEVDPNDPWTDASGFVCRDGLCEGKQLGCASEDDCATMQTPGWPALRCKLPD